MRRKPLFWSLLGLLCVAVVYHLSRPATSSRPPLAETRSSTNSPLPAPSRAAALATSSKNTTNSPAKRAAGVALDPKKLFPYRLSNTDEAYDKLVRNDRGILLMNAAVDTGKPLNLTIPDRLRAPANNGSYIVQARGALDDSFRTALAGAGAAIISYIPNNAYLVRVSEGGAQQLSGVAQSVLPYEPYYKLDPSLLKMAIETPDAVPSGGGLNVTLFPDAGDAGVAALQKLGAQVVSQDRTPFGPVVQVLAAPGTLAAMASLPAVQGISTWSPKHVSNDLMRPLLGVSVDSTNPANYLGLTGTNVNISVNDTGVDVQHPDLSNSGNLFHITSDDGAILTAQDPDGHGTHVIGTILGTGVASLNTSVYPNGVPAQGSVSNANFRGMAPGANAYVSSFNAHSDSYLQSNAVMSLPHTRISNNSWNYANSSYDIFAASYDAAVRDANPFASGPQPLMFVFSAGNNGGGDDNGQGENADTILSPATAKNVITVGAIKEQRNIAYYMTNVVTTTNGNPPTNMMVTNIVTNIVASTSDTYPNEVAFFSSCGNVGIYTEGTAGRFKPDLVAPGTYVVSCRSAKWDTNAYYNPSNYDAIGFPGLSISTNSLYTLPGVLIPPNVVGIQIYVSGNILSPDKLPTVPIYGVLDAYATNIASELLGTNTVIIPTNGAVNTVALNPGSTVYFGILNTNSLQTLNLDATVVVITTNATSYLNDGVSFSVLSNLNGQIGPYYRYESGTSMAAAGVSGMLACMQEYFETRLGVTNSPAMMKALLINGARSAGPLYDFGTSDLVNFQGWGLPNLPNSTPGSFTNTSTAANLAALPFLMFDQTNALATGQSATWQFTLSPQAQNQDLHVTLVWTDPPGNPNAGTKLVNDLDLIVMDGASNVYYGNDIPVGSLYNEVGNTNAPITDSVNNVENVYLQAPQAAGTYTVTVLGRRVNVNAVTGNTNGIVQDFALVVSSGDANSGVTNPIALVPSTGFTTNASAVVAGTPALTNVFIVTNGFPLFNQRVGANSQFAVNTQNTYATNGTLAQWNFYVYTNIPTVSSNDPNPANYTNVAIATIVPPNLGVPRLGAYNEVDPDSTNATRDAGADIDLYVSQDYTLTNLNPTAIAAAWAAGTVSVTRSGTEAVLLTNSSPGQVYYIGVKSEDQQAAQFLLFAESTDQSFNNVNSNGDILVTMLPAPPPFPLFIPGGSAPAPQHALILGFTTSTANIRNVIVTNTVTFPDFGDLIGTLSLHSDTGDKTDVLNNHTYFTNANDATETFVYDDSGQTPGARKSDGPGSTENFTGAKASGVWMFTMVNDSSTSDTGYIQNFQVVVQPQIVTNRYTETIPPMSWFYNYVDVPSYATNLSIFVTPTASTLPQPLQLYIKEGAYPTTTFYDVYESISPPGGVASINKYTSPPLNAGRYFYGVYNPNTVSETVNFYVEVDDSLNPVATYNFFSKGNEAIPDDAVMYSTNYVANNAAVVSAEVGVRIIHPRESDLVLTLVSPTGTRVLLAENRGGLDTNGYGSGFNTTNAVSATSGGVSSSTNVINISTNFGTVSGTLIVNYNMYVLPDEMEIIYGGQVLTNTGLVSGSNTFTLNFGPGSATNILIVMNPPGANTDASSDQWAYTATVITANATYATFTEDTNTTTLPIKFAVPPFGGGPAFSAPTTLKTDSFESPATTNFVTDGFFSSVAGNTNSATAIVAVPQFTTDGSNVLALHDGAITATLPTVLGQNYTLTFASHGKPDLGPIGWWKGESSTTDYGSLNNQSGTFTEAAYTNGIVGQAFAFDPENFPPAVGVGILLDDEPGYALTNSLTIEGWIRPRGNSQFIFCRSDDLHNVDYALNMEGNNYLEFQIANETSALDTPLVYGVWYHVAATLDGATGIMNIYTNGVLANSNPAISKPMGMLGTGAGIGIGNTHEGVNNSPFIGDVDEIALYNYALTQAQVQDIYAAGSAGKILPGESPVTANFILGNNTNQFSSSEGWSSNIFTFTAPNNNLTLTFAPATNTDGTLQDGTILDSFSLTADAVRNPTNFYLPEEPLTKLVGEGSQGAWTLEVLDNRAGPFTSNAPTLVSWELSLVLANTLPFASALTHHIPQTNIVQPNEIVYYEVAVPIWAKYATNILTVTSGGSTVAELFNQTTEPTGTIPPDVALISSTTTGGTVTLNTNTGSPLLVPGQTYYLGIQNLSSSQPATFTIEVDFDITTLTNAVPITNQVIANGTVPRYFQFDVDTNAVAVKFQILNPSGNVELVASYGPPLPDEFNFAYSSDLPGASAQNIIVISNSTPVPLAPGRWYLGVFNNDTTPVNYTIVATETGAPIIIPLTDGVAVNGIAPPGPPFTTFYSFSVTNTSPAALFELYNLTGNADLWLDLSPSLPYAAPIAAQSDNFGTNEEQIVVRTTNTTRFATLRLVTNSVNGFYYLGVPNNTSMPVSYTIRASLPTNGILMAHEPIEVTVGIPPGGGGPTLTWTGVAGNCYEVEVSTDLVNWTNFVGSGYPGYITSTTSTLVFRDTTPVGMLPPYRFYRIVQIDCGP